jgi:23S rRNA pseudouridine2605 synthase
MPPRFAYWTILIDDKPTAFRAREREELQPTFIQLQRKSANVIMRWFARGKLWESRDAEREDFQRQRLAASAPRERQGDAQATERRGGDWRPGGSHKDPRDRFKKKNRPERAWSEKDPATQRDRDKPGYAAPRDRGHGDRPWQNKQPRAHHAKPHDRRPWTDKPAPPNDRPWQTKPTGPRAQRKPWTGKPSGGSGWSGKPSGAAPRNDRPWQNKPGGGSSGGVHGRGDKPAGGPPGGPPWRNRSAGGGRRPWTGGTSGDQRKPFVPRGGQSRPRFDGPPRKKRNDDPDRD